MVDNLLKPIPDQSRTVFPLLFFIELSVNAGLLVWHSYHPVRQGTYQQSSGTRAHSFVAWLSRVWVTFRSAVLCASQFWLGVPHHWIYLWPQGAVPLGFNSLSFIPWCLRHPTKGKADGARDIFGTTGCIWATVS